MTKMSASICCALIPPSGGPCDATKARCPSRNWGPKSWRQSSRSLGRERFGGIALVALQNYCSDVRLGRQASHYRKAERGREIHRSRSVHGIVHIGTDRDRPVSLVSHDDSHQTERDEHDGDTKQQKQICLVCQGTYSTLVFRPLVIVASGPVIVPRQPVHHFSPEKKTHDESDNDEQKAFCQIHKFRLPLGICPRITFLFGVLVLAGSRPAPKVPGQQKNKYTQYAEYADYEGSFDQQLCERLHMHRQGQRPGADARAPVRLSRQQLQAVPAPRSPRRFRGFQIMAEIITDGSLMQRSGPRWNPAHALRLQRNNARRARRYASQGLRARGPLNAALLAPATAVPPSQTGQRRQSR
jgi:hypothetical protein